MKSIKRKLSDHERLAILQELFSQSVSEANVADPARFNYLLRLCDRGIARLWRFWRPTVAQFLCANEKLRRDEIARVETRMAARLAKRNKLSKAGKPAKE